MSDVVTDGVVDLLVRDARSLAVDTERTRRSMLVLARQRQETILGLHAWGLSVRVIAQRLGSSPSVIQDALRTARSRHPGARREERLPYELHVMLGLRLAQDPEGLRVLARANLARMRESPRAPIARRWLDRWEEILELPDEDLEVAMLADDEQGRDLRQISPFAGALTAEDRLTAMKKVQLLEKA
jgi:hypothetical protein